MKCVIDTSAVSWMQRIGRLKLLPQLYETIYAPPLVFVQLASHYATKDFVDAHMTPIPLRDEEEIKRFNKLSVRWKKKADLDDLADAQVFVGHLIFADSDEAVYANKDAEEKLSRFGRVRDIAHLYELAEDKHIFTRIDSRDFLQSFLTVYPPYRKKHVDNLLKHL